MPTELERTVRYTVRKGDGPGKVRDFRLVYRPCAPLASGETNHDVFSGTIRDLPPNLLRDVLTDLYRHLVFGNYASSADESSGKRADLSAFPHRGALEEGRSPDSASRLSGETNALGATLQLLLDREKRKRAGDPYDDTYLVLAGVFAAMLDHPKYRKENDGRPKVHLASE